MSKNMVMIDGNEAAAHVAYRVSEVVAIYPITPSSPMGEWADEWASRQVRNIWGDIPLVQEMQSEGGAAGAVHGALQTGAMTTTFTASQGLLLMIPNMFKIAGELTASVFHVAARTVATHALSIFGDHSDVMAARSTGFALFCSGSIQEITDFALISSAATLESRVPFVHFFDGFRSSHEVSKLDSLSDEVIRSMINEEYVEAHHKRGLTPDAPVLRGTAQNPDVFFQAREAAQPFYDRCADIVQAKMDEFGKLTGRHYKLFDYYGAPDAERVIVMMGSGAEAAHEAIDYLVAKGEKVGLVKVRLFRPFSVKALVSAVPASTKTLAVLDRTKEPGSIGEPLYMDVVNAFAENGAAAPKIIGGRYGLSSKEFTPAMVKGLLDEMLKSEPKNHFTLGINDDVSGSSIDFDPDFSTEPDSVIRAMFYGLGSDGTVGANKNSIKIIGSDTDNYAQGYFVYDSKKSGAVTVSHLRFGPDPIRSTYLITKANFIGCHQFFLMDQLDILKYIDNGGTFLLNSPYPADAVWDKLPKIAQKRLIDKKVALYVIDGYKVAEQTGMGTRINTIMQTCFFAISGVLPRDEAIASIKNAIKKTYGKKGDDVVQKNFEAVDKTLENLHKVEVPAAVSSTSDLADPIHGQADDFVKNVLGKIISREGDDLPVSAFTVDGTFPTATTRYEKRNVALNIPIWDKDLCIQCGKCAMVCPHAVIRTKVSDAETLKNAPETFKSVPAKNKAWAGMNFTVQVSAEDCTGCGACINVCPAKSKEAPSRKAINFGAKLPILEQEKKNWDFFLSIPNLSRTTVNRALVRDVQMLEPLFEFSGACAGCGETAYVRLLSQLFGDRAVIANATGCSSIYSGNLPTTPWAKNKDGRGPAWSNSLFEDNAEFGLGFRLSIDKQSSTAVALVEELKGEVGAELASSILAASQKDDAEIEKQRARVDELKKKLVGIDGPKARRLALLADMLVKKSVWILGGDGWAYDIGYGGLDHVLASGKNVNVLVLDTEVYSNTGGQASKATPRAAVAKFAAAGKPAPKKDLGQIAMTYGNIYVASIAMGANDSQALKAFVEAEAYDGPSIIIAYSHCIAHGINMMTGLENQKDAVSCGYWPLYRFNPALAAEGKNPFQFDSAAAPKMTFKDYAYKQNRFKMLTKSKPEEAERLIVLAQQDMDARRKVYESLAAK